MIMIMIMIMIIIVIIVIIVVIIKTYPGIQPRIPHFLYTLCV